jgi:hypothetical protein
VMVKFTCKRSPLWHFIFSEVLFSGQYKGNLGYFTFSDSKYTLEGEYISNTTKCKYKTREN